GLDPVREHALNAEHATTPAERLRVAVPALDVDRIRVANPHACATSPLARLSAGSPTGDRFGPTLPHVEPGTGRNLPGAGVEVHPGQAPAPLRHGPRAPCSVPGIEQLFEHVQRTST